MGATVTGKVISERYRPSPLLQGGLEIPIEISVEWENETALRILAEKVRPLENKTEYNDESKEILKEILGEDGDVEDEDDDFETEDLNTMIENAVGTANNNEEENSERDDDGDDPEESDIEEHARNIRKHKIPKICVSSDEDDIV